MKSFGLNDTIAAISTPLGQGGIGIIRLSGKDALSIADKIFVSKDRNKRSTYKTYSVHYGWIVNSRKPNKKDRRQDIIDEVLLTVMRAPRSYTKEDIVEISCHSGIVVLREILDLVLSSGARLAEKGEFTKRAFLNGRIDLSRAEAVLDIINAKTGLALESGIKQLKGELSDEVSRLRIKLLDALVLLEANIDFPEEEIENAVQQKMEPLTHSAKGGMPKRPILIRTPKGAVLWPRGINKIINEVLARVEVLLSSAKHGKVLREGVSAVILGKANAGKSSLLNALLKEERAIVTPIAGTTRDAIEEILDLKGIPLKITDTAGIIEPRDLIEREALARTQRYFEKANLVLLVFDSSLGLNKEDRQLIEKAKHRTAIAVLNKSDLKQRIDEAKISKHIPCIVKISCLRQKGLKELEAKIIQAVWEGKLGVSDEVIVTNARHIQALKNGQRALERAKGSLEKDLSIEFIAEDLKICRNHLSEIAGETMEEDILEKIFSEFCIGK